MYRLLMITALVIGTTACTTADAKGPWGKWFRGRGVAKHSHRTSPTYGIGVGIGTYPGFGYSSFGYVDPYRFDGFGYDPYRYGSFRAPDLLDDPYFNAQHKFDSHFPGRYGHRHHRRPIVVGPAPIGHAPIGRHHGVIRRPCDH